MRQVNVDSWTYSVGSNTLYVQNMVDRAVAERIKYATEKLKQAGFTANIHTDSVIHHNELTPIIRVNITVDVIDDADYALIQLIDVKM